MWTLVVEPARRSVTFNPDHVAIYPLKHGRQVIISEGDKRSEGKVVISNNKHV